MDSLIGYQFLDEFGSIVTVKAIDGNKALVGEDLLPDYYVEKEYVLEIKRMSDEARKGGYEFEI